MHKTLLKIALGVVLAVTISSVLIELDFPGGLAAGVSAGLSVIIAQNVLEQLGVCDNRSYST